MRLGFNLFRGLFFKKSIRESLDRKKLVSRASGSFGGFSGSNIQAHGIVFSMDRGLQLHALLGSYLDKVDNAAKLTVIYRATTERHRDCYSQVLSEYDDLIETAIEQPDRQSFKSLLVDAMSRTEAEYIFFLVDDIIFLENMDMMDLLRYATPYSIPSMRLGENIRYAYTGKKKQTKPDLEHCSSRVDGLVGKEELLYWVWAEGKIDWSYPLSVDGHIFQRREVLAIAQAVEFDSPNRFEAKMQKFNFAFEWRIGVCFRKSKVLNIPYNRVQTDYENVHGNVHQDDMLKQWERGLRIDRSFYYGFSNTCVHQELPLQLIMAEAE